MVLPLPRSFYDRPTVEVARDLLGCVLHRRIGGRHLSGRVVETEAYVGPEDLACHTSKGLTPRTEPMFGSPGHAYVYLIYGLHHCLNVVTEGPGSGTAVLIRALEPLSGLSPEARTDGPARLTRVFEVNRDFNRWDLTSGEELWIEAPDRPREPIEVGKRIGVEYAKEWADAPLRFWLSGNRWVSVVPRRPRGPVVEAPSLQRSAKDRPDRA
ncbi:DNA-3-methyladenine glycosylase [Vulgatibacter incomptus]|nr:DNA-3-methyladenine glycosylase [Vulgatibacter incomptus]